MSDERATEVAATEEQLAPTATRLAELLPGAVLETTVHRGDTTVVVAPERLVEVCTLLRDDEQTRFDYLVDVTAVDWTPRSPRFDVVYHLWSIPLNHALRVKTRAGDEESVPTLSGVWGLADWGERETYDMFGIVFEGHPDPRRILLPEDWEDGFPLRKDYPTGGYGIWASENVPFR
jgi:NADH-quinone oxidoreductase subunit C